MDKTKQVLKYIFADWFTASLAWFLFYFYRKQYIEQIKFGLTLQFEFELKLYQGLLLIPFFWVAFYAITGNYRNVLRKSRLKEFANTFIVSLIGVLLIFFVSILDDEVISYKTYYQSFLTLFSLHFLLTFIARFTITSITVHNVHSRRLGFNTLLVGCNEKAWKLYNELEAMAESTGNKFVGFVHIDNKNSYYEELKKNVPHLGNYKDINGIIDEYKIEEVIIAVESSEHSNIEDIINQLDNPHIAIKVIPDMYDILAGSVKMTSIFGAPLIEISYDIMPPWQQNLKRAIDIGASMLALLILLPLNITLALLVKLTSKGPIFYSHERIGIHGKPFTIYKFRSMYVGSEKNGPALSSRNDSRITPIGKHMRKTRLDEIPQFYNVLIGEMSLVGPRPERQYFIDQITKVAPHYKHLHKIKPGITSWGQVKYGYAENVEQMVQRLKYDILYIENMSLAVDFKIMIYTILIVLKGKGK